MGIFLCSGHDHVCHRLVFLFDHLCEYYLPYAINLTWIPITVAEIRVVVLPKFYARFANLAGGVYSGVIIMNRLDFGITITRML